MADERGRALIRTLAAAVDRTPPDALRLDWATCDAALLPAGVRGLGLQDFMFDGITEPIVRRFLANADELKALAGSLSGIRFGLALLGMSVDWRSWHGQTPKGAPGTFDAVVFVQAPLTDDPDLFSPESFAAARAMVDAMKRWSQEGDLDLGLGTIGTVRAASANASLALHRADGDVPPDADETGATGTAAALATLAHHRVAADVPPGADETAASGMAGAIAALSIHRAHCEVIQ